MTYKVFKGQIDIDFVRFIADTLSEVDGKITILISSTGGYADDCYAAIGLLNTNHERVTLSAWEELKSAAVDLFVWFDGYTIVNPLTSGLVHQSKFNLPYNEEAKGSAMRTVLDDYCRDRIIANNTLENRIYGRLNDTEKAAYKSGLDVLLSCKRLNEIINGSEL